MYVHKSILLCTIYVNSYELMVPLGYLMCKNNMFVIVNFKYMISYSDPILKDPPTDIRLNTRETINKVDILDISRCLNIYCVG